MGNLKDELGFFTVIPEAIIELTPEIGSDAVFIYLYLRYRTNKKRGVAWPSYETMRKDIRWGRQRISNALKKLELRGLLIKNKRFGKSTEYILPKPPYTGGTDEQTPSSTGAVLTQGNGSSTGAVLKKSRSGTAVVPERDYVLKTESKQTESKQTDKRGNRPPAVELCKRIIHRFPHKSIWKTIDRKVGHEFGSLLRWGRLLRKWKLNNWNITNYKGMLEAFARERGQDENIDYESDKHRRSYAKGWFDD